MKPSVVFTYQFPRFRVRNSSEVKRWMRLAFRREKKSFGKLNIIFCSDKFLFDINKKFLKHHFLTDVITFHYNKKKEPVEGEIFISVERVKSNAKKFDAAFKDELHRVIIHGVLHLCGYNDSTATSKSAMRKKENKYLLERNF